MSEPVSPIGSVPCPGSWEPIWCPDPDTPPEGDDAVVEQQVTAAAEILYQLSGQRFGQCELTLRPCRRNCWGSRWPYGTRWPEWDGGSWPTPLLRDGAWFNIGCAGGCPGTCSCTELSEALLPGPADVTEVKLDGEVLEPDVDYRLDDHRILVRLGGEHWPVCQDLDQPDSEVGTWSVTALFGEPLPVSGQRALGELAGEFIKACVGDKSCALPKPVQQLVRQGVTMTFLDPNEVWGDGRIGLTFSDLFLAAFNPHRLPGRPQVFDVDGLPWRRAGV